MLYNDFCSEFNVCIEKGEYDEADALISRELGAILASNKRDFVDLLNESGISASINDSNVELVNRFVDNIVYNDKLRLGTSLLVNSKNQEIGFDGKKSINKDNVRNCYRVMTNKYSNFVDPNIIASAVQSASDLGTQALKGRQQRKGGGLEIAKQREAQKAEIIKAIADKKKVEAESKAKTNRILLIVGGSLLGLVVLTALIIKKRKK
jgi:hypothetical protein